MQQAVRSGIIAVATAHCELPVDAVASAGVARRATRCRLPVHRTLHPCASPSQYNMPSLALKQHPRVIQLSISCRQPALGLGTLGYIFAAGGSKGMSLA